MEACYSLLIFDTLATIIAERRQNAQAESIVDNESCTGLAHNNSSGLILGTIL